MTLENIQGDEYIVKRNSTYSCIYDINYFNGITRYISHSVIDNS